MEHLILRLEAPLMAFGGESIDNLGVIRRFPSASMLTGLLANAFGWRRVETRRHQELQDRLVFATRIDREPAGVGDLIDFQTARLGASDQGWTTRGRPEGRAGGPQTYLAPHLRFRHFHADMRVTVALRLEPADTSPSLEDLARALEQPARPLFIGRKPCLPSAPILSGTAEGETALSALRLWPLPHDVANSYANRDGGRQREVALMWPDGEGDGESVPTRTYMVTDQRNWDSSGLHGGGRLVHEGARFSGEFGSQQRPQITNG